MRAFIYLLPLVLLVGCTYDYTPTGNGNGTPTLTHNELAEKFVQQLNLDADFSVTLAKKSTLQDNFIVIYDPNTESYDAINIDNYDPTIDNASEYYHNNASRGFFNLTKQPGYSYEDYEYEEVGRDANNNPIYGYVKKTKWVPTRYLDETSGFKFEKVSASSKDLAKITAIKEAAEIQKSAEFLSSEFGLSVQRGKEIASLKAHWKKASKKGMTDSEVDAFSTELLGFSISSGLKAYHDSLDGDSSTLESLVNQSASLNSISPEHASKLMTKVFGL